MGNLQSVKNALARFGVKAEIANDVSKIDKSDASFCQGLVHLTSNVKS